MRRECAWCREYMGSTYQESSQEWVITHGICEKCANMLFSKLGIELTTFLDSLASPVVVVDETGSVKTANKHAQALLKKDLSDIEGYKGGEVFMCAYSKLPEGCGDTIHCSGCTIRRTVMDTFESGRSHLRIPATLNRGVPGDCRKIEFLISTEKVEEVVLLRIDRVGNRLAVAA